MAAIQQLLASYKSEGSGPTSWTFTYSTKYSAAAEPTQANMSDGSSLTYWGSNFGEPAFSNIFLQADFGSAKTLTSISYRAARSADGFGTTYLNGATLEYSVDGTSWTTATTISGASESVTNTYTLPAPVSARYVRVKALRDNGGSLDVNSYIALSEFHFT